MKRASKRTATTKRVLIPVAMATGILLSTNHVSRAGSNEATMNHREASGKRKE